MLAEKQNSSWKLELSQYIFLFALHQSLAIIHTEL